jgi:glutamate/tyrosine decarboxylase-like PLP-dependent enzyme
MNGQLEKDLAAIDALLELAKEESAKFLQAVPDRKTSTGFTKDQFNRLQNGIGASDTLRQFIIQYDKAIVASTGPRYWGFVTGGSTPAAIMGDWLATVYDQNTQSFKGHGDVSALIEKDAVGLLLDLFGLPDTYHGGFVTGATMSNFTCLATARQWLGRQYDMDIAREGISASLPVLTATPHSSSLKALSMLGMGSSRIIRVPVMTGNREAIDIAALEQAISTLAGKPFILISSAATVNTADFDDFAAIAALKKKYEFWWHIDAAFGGFAALSPLHRDLLNGWDSADSITIDFHKWLNVPYENAGYFIKQEHSQAQVETFQNSNAPYLGDPLTNFNYLNFLPENSRRLRALPVWFTLMAYGRDGYEYIVSNSIAMAKLFGDYVSSHASLELLAPVRLNTVCFTLKGMENQDRVTSLLDAINDSGEVFMTQTIYNGRKGIRAAFVNWRTTREDVEKAIGVMDGKLEGLVV